MDPEDDYMKSLFGDEEDLSSDEAVQQTSLHLPSFLNLPSGPTHQTTPEVVQSPRSWAAEGTQHGGLHLPGPIARLGEPSYSAAHRGSVQPHALLLPSQPAFAASPPAGSPSETAASPLSASSPGADGKRKNKARMNWSDAESERLLQGVELHGIGNWAKIRQDPQFDLGHRKNVDLKDRFRTVFPNEYRLHNDQIKAKKGIPILPGASTAQAEAPTGTSSDPIFVELDYHAARLHKKLHRKKIQRKKNVEPVEEPPTREKTLVSVALTATGRRKVTIKKDTPWSAAEDADLEDAFSKHKRRWRGIAADRSYAFYGRSILDIRDRFAHLYPDRVNAHPGSMSPEPDLGNVQERTDFQKGLVNGFGTKGVSSRQARRISSVVTQGGQNQQIDTPVLSQTAYPASPTSPIEGAAAATNFSPHYTREAPSYPGTYTIEAARDHIRRLDSVRQSPHSQLERLSVPPTNTEQLCEHILALTASLSPSSVNASQYSPSPTQISSFTCSPAPLGQLERSDGKFGSRTASPLEFINMDSPHQYAVNTPTPTFPVVSEQHYHSPGDLYDLEPASPSLEDQALGSPVAV
ncbi:hypothetical protein AA313_de0207165 [Arthrobotrys entomopaga]|nr:hypothetical protein AA313_de0207165 [Arthrobotrys entomopaga]